MLPKTLNTDKNRIILFETLLSGVYTKGKTKTNNAVESFHSPINSHVKHSHPSFWSFIEYLVSFHLIVMADFQDLHLEKPIHRYNKQAEASNNQKLLIHSIHLIT
jgi:hypothetical protein